MRCEFIPTILHASIAIAKKLTSQDIFIVLQKDISGEDATGRVKVWKSSSVLLKENHATLRLDMPK
jgi:hypothetical protein